MSTPITDSATVEGGEPWYPWVYADRMKALELAANAMEEALQMEEAWRDEMNKGEMEDLRIKTAHLRRAALAQYRRLKQ